MSFFRKVVHSVGHVVWLGAQYGAAASPYIPAEYKPLVAAALGLIQVIHGFYVGKQVANGSKTG